MGFNVGSKYDNSLLTRLRVGRTYLNAHSYTIGHAITNTCSCDDKTPEMSLHFLISCPKLTEMRRTLFDQVEQQFVPTLKRLSMQRQFEILVY